MKIDFLYCFLTLFFLFFIRKMNIQQIFYYLSMDEIDMVYSPFYDFNDSNDYMSESTESFSDPDSDYEPDSDDSGNFSSDED